MPVVCRTCQAENDDSADNCFECGRGLFVLTNGALLAGRYEIKKPLGKGGMGIVYRAYDRDLDEAVAIKVLQGDVARSKAMSRRFRDEIRLARKVRHENVCAIHEYGQDGHLRFIVMELVEGADLKALLRERPLPPGDALDIGIQIADGLAAIHRAGIVHRDLKTPNLMRDLKGHVRVMDFGIAKGFDDTGGGLTGTGQVVGTPEYMSPEQGRGEHVDARSDVYALGVVVYELFAGDVPFHGDTPMATIYKHIQEPPPFASAPQIPPAVVPLLEKALAKRPADRYQSAAELAADLRKVRELVPPEPIPLPAAKPSEYTTNVIVPSSPARAAAVRVEDEIPTEVTPRALPASALAVTPVPPPTPSSLPAAQAPSYETRAVPELADPAPAGAEPSYETRAVPAPRPPRSSGRRMPVILIAGTLVLGTGAWLRLRSSETARPPEIAPAPRTAIVNDTPEPLPSPARARADAATRAPTQAPTAEPAAVSYAAPIKVAATRPATTEPRTSTATASSAPSPAPAAATTPHPATAAPSSGQATDDLRPGTLVLKVKPSSAEVLVDGVKAFERTVSLPPGTHSVVITHPDFEPLRRTVRVRPTETSTLVVDVKDEAIKKKR